MTKYLKPRLHYVDLYDRYTVQICRRIENSFKNNEVSDSGVKGIGKKDAKRIKAAAHEWYLRIQVGERYLNKEQTIREWMESDEKRDNLLEFAKPPDGIRCLTCRNIVKPTFKELWHEVGKEERVLFMFDCPNQCLPRRSFFSDGEEWRPDPHLCPNCQVPLVSNAEDDGKKLVTTRKCPKCQHSETDEFTWSSKEKEFDPDFATDRDRFCLTDEQGREFSDFKYSVEQMSKFVDEWKEKEKELAARLDASPNGFILEGIGRTCSICGNGSREDGSWYDKYGLKCLVCQKAIDVGEIPASLAKNKESWYSKYDLESAFNLTTPTLRKWVREGIIKSRIVTHYGTGVHTELFLLADNEGFLPPKRLVKSRLVTTKKDGKTWHRSEEWYKFVDPFKHLKGYKIMDHMRVIPPEEMKAREEAEKKKQEEKRKLREAKLAFRQRCKVKKKSNPLRLGGVK